MDDLYGNAWSSSDKSSREEELPNVELPSKPPSDELDASWKPSENLAGSTLARSGSEGWKVGEDLAWNGTSTKPSLWSGDKGSTGVIPDSDVWGPAAGFQESSSQHLPPEPSENEAKGDGTGGDDDESDAAHYEVPPRSPSPGTIVQEHNEAPPPASVISKVDVTEEEAQAVVGSVTVDSFDDEFQWNSPAPAFDNSKDDVWESAWTSAEPSSTLEESPKDEWEVAKEQALRRQRVVPPEVMASIMQRLNDISEEIWPAKESDGDSSQIFGNWRDGISSVEGLSELVKTALPEVALQPLPPYPKTNTAKAVNNSLRLSRNLPLVRHSPLSHLFASKAASAWELSVKNKVEIQRDDVPAGWRMVEPEAAKETKTFTTEKKSTGILSFWSRRTASTSSASTSEAKPVQPPERTASPSASLKKYTTPSAPVARSSKDMDRASQSGRATPEPSSSITSAASPPEVANLGVQPPAAVSPSTSFIPETPAAPQPPSAVSRFWNRFSRTKSDVRSASTSPRDSIALSTNELDFLSDIVPSAHDGDDEEDLLGSLSSAKVRAKDADVPPPPALAPPPLAPPVRANTLTSAAGILAANSKPMISTRTSAMDDLSSLFDSAPTSNNSTSQSSPVNPVSVPPLLPPPIMPLSKPPSPSPSPFSSAKPAHSRTSSRSDSSPITSSPLRTSSPANFTRSVASSVSPITISSSRAASPSVQTTAMSAMRGLSSSPIKPLPMPPPTASLNTFDDDEFSAFHSPTQPTPGFPLPTPSSTPLFHNHKQEASFSSLSDSSFLSHPDEPSQDGDDSFGDFSNFVSTPPPPRSLSVLSSPPLPAPPPPRSPTPPKPPRKNSKANLHIRKPSEEERRAVENLVEKAAARPGRWPALPSPIPELLPKPPGGSTSTRTTSAMAQQQTDFFSFSPGLPASPGLLMPIAQPNGTSPAWTPPSNSVFGAMQASLIPPPPSLSAPPPSGPRRPPSVTQKPFALQSTAATPPPSYNSSAIGKSGLSAQDLSFFEGL